MRHVCLLCLLLLAKLVVCNALLPALTCSSQFAAHVRSSHMDSSGAEKRATLVMTAASEASDPVSITPDQPMRQGKQKAKHQKCVDPACTGIQASYGYAHDKKRIRCATHKEEGMIYLIGKLCEEPTCRKQACFGPSDTELRFCAVTTMFQVYAARLNCQLLVQQYSPCQPAQYGHYVANIADAFHRVKSGSSILCYTQERNHGERGVP
eukprot:900-Heterococcus_DN1.PRE.2